MKLSNISSKINCFNLDNKRVFLRADLNISIVNNKIAGDFKLQSILPTINLLIEKNAKIILATHIGRPEKAKSKEKKKSLSTEILVSWFKDRNYTIFFEPDLDKAIKKSNFIKPKEILLLQNLRFYTEEKSQNIKFADKLKELADFYVNDAFALLHRTDTSITLLPRLFDKEHKTIGLLIQKELDILSKIKNNPDRPFVLIMGGAKVKTKLPLIKNLINIVDIILLCPAIVFTFLKAQNISVGKSLVEDSLIKEANNILDIAKKQNKKIIFPIDYQIALDNINGQLKYINSCNFPENSIGIAVGPNTIEKFKPKILNAKTIFLNGQMGFNKRPETLEAFKLLLQLIAKSNAFSVIGGGDSVAAVYKYGLNKDIDFCSTGGGATLSYLSGNKLPGLEYIIC